MYIPLRQVNLKGIFHVLGMLGICKTQPLLSGYIILVDPQENLS